MSPGPPLPSSEGRWMRREIDRSIARAWIHIVGGGREVTDSHYHSGSSRRHSGLDPRRSGLDSLPHTAATTRRQSATAARHRWGRKEAHVQPPPPPLGPHHRQGEGGPAVATRPSSMGGGRTHSRHPPFIDLPHTAAVVRRPPSTPLVINGGREDPQQPSRP
jgi:hypothetical protein